MSSQLDNHLLPYGQRNEQYDQQYDENDQQYDKDNQQYEENDQQYDKNDQQYDKDNQQDVQDDELNDNDENDENDENHDRNNFSHDSDGDASAYFAHLEGMPMIPTRRLEEGLRITPAGVNEVPEYYVVLSPRETRGVAGPFTVDQIREQIESDEITNRTLVWKGGNDDWHQIRHMPLLYPRVQKRPPIPTRQIDPNISTISALDYEMDSLFSPEQQIDGAETFVPSLSRTCVKCGAYATVCTPGVGDQPLAAVVTQPVGVILPPQVASEIIPGFLWVGNAGAGRVSSIEALGITLVINCTETIKSPPSRPPLYRCQRAPLKEFTPHTRVSEFSSEESILMVFEGVYRYMDWERLHSERVKESDVAMKLDRVLPVKYTGPTNNRGLPKFPPLPINVRDKLRAQAISKKEKISKGNKGNKGNLPQVRGGPAPPPRILLWSRLGNDRPCAIAAAYMIKCWGVGLDTALNSMRKTREGMNMSMPYLNALRKWEKMHAIGETLCADCVESSVEKLKMRPPHSLHSLSYDEISLVSDTSRFHGGGVGELIVTGGTNGVTGALSGRDGMSGTNGMGGGGGVSDKGGISARVGVSDRRRIDNGNNNPPHDEHEYNMWYKDFTYHLLMQEPQKVPDRYMDLGPSNSSSSGEYPDRIMDLGPTISSEKVPDRNWMDLGPVGSYLVPVPIPPGGADKGFLLFDLKLGGRVMGDNMAVTLFSALSSAKLMSRLRDIDLQGNQLSCVAIGVICHAFLPGVFPSPSSLIGDNGGHGDRDGTRGGVVTGVEIGGGIGGGVGGGTEDQTGVRKGSSIEDRTGHSIENRNGDGVGDRVGDRIGGGTGVEVGVGVYRQGNLGGNQRGHLGGNRIGDGAGGRIINSTSTALSSVTGRRPVVEDIQIRELVLSHNDIDTDGAANLSLLLKSCHFIEKLDMNGNNIGDIGCAKIAHTLAVTPLAFIDDDEGNDETTLGWDRPSEREKSMKILNFSNTGIGVDGMLQLADALRTNTVLSTLHLEYCDIPSLSMKALMSAIKEQKNTLSRITFADTPISVKSLDYILKAFEGKQVALAHLDLSRCGLTSKHIGLFSKNSACPCRYSDPHCFSQSHSLLYKLTSLTLSGNHFGDSGTFFLASFLTGSGRAVSGVEKKPLTLTDPGSNPTSSTYYSYRPMFALQWLDVSDCGVTRAGLRGLLEAIVENNGGGSGGNSIEGNNEGGQRGNNGGGKSCLVHLDVSCNPLGPHVFSAPPAAPITPKSPISPVAPRGAVSPVVHVSSMVPRLTGGGGSGEGMSGGESKVNKMESTEIGVGGGGSVGSYGGQTIEARSGSMLSLLPTSRDLGSNSRINSNRNSTPHTPHSTSTPSSPLPSHPTQPFNYHGMTECLQLLSRCPLRDLRLNRTEMHSSSAVCLLQLLGHVSTDRTGTTILGRTLKRLCLGENKICDGPGISGALKGLKENNMTLGLLELDFNNLTSETTTFAAQADGPVSSTADLRLRLLPLSVSVIGNQCLPYALKAPVRSVAAQYGIHTEHNPWNVPGVENLPGNGGWNLIQGPHGGGTGGAGGGGGVGGGGMGGGGGEVMGVGGGVVVVTGKGIQQSIAITTAVTTTIPHFNCTGEFLDIGATQTDDTYNSRNRVARVGATGEIVDLGSRRQVAERRELLEAFQRERDRGPEIPNGHLT